MFVNRLFKFPSLFKYLSYGSVLTAAAIWLNYGIVSLVSSPFPPSTAQISFALTNEIAFIFRSFFFTHLPPTFCDTITTAYFTMLLSLCSKHLQQMKNDFLQAKKYVILKRNLKDKLDTISLLRWLLLLKYISIIKLISFFFSFLLLGINEVI